MGSGWLPHDDREGSDNSKSGRPNRPSKSDSQSEAASSTDDPLPDLAIQPSSYDLQLPQNTQEAKNAWENEAPIIMKDLLRSYEGMETDRAVRELIVKVNSFFDEVEGSGDTISDALNSERESLKQEIRNMRRELELEREEEDELQDWRVRIDRFLDYIRYLYPRLPNDMGITSAEGGELVQNHILLGGGKYGANKNNLPGGLEGLDNHIMDQMSKDGISTTKTAIKDNTYGAATAIEDLNKLYNRNLKPFLDEDSSELESSVDLLQEFSETLKKNVKTLNYLMQIKVIVAQIEEEENVEEMLVEKFEKNSHMDTTRVEKAMLGGVKKDKEDVESLETTSEKLLREEKWMVDHIEEAREILENVFSMEDRMAAQEEESLELLQSGAGSNDQMYISDLLGELESSSASPGKQYFTDLKEIYLNVVDGIREIRKIESQQITNVVRVRAQVDKTLDIVGKEKQIERNVEADIVDEVDSEAEIEEKLYETVESHVERVTDAVEDDTDFESLFVNFENRKSQFIDLLSDFRDSTSPEDEFLKRDKINTQIETVDKVLQQVREQIDEAEKGNADVLLGVKVEIEVEDTPFDDTVKVEDAVEWCLNELSNLDEAVESEAVKNNEEYFNMVEKVEEELSSFETMRQAALGAEQTRKELEDQLEDNFPSDNKDVGMEEFRDELGLLHDLGIDGVANEFKEGGKALQIMEAARELLENVDKVDAREIRLVETASEVEGDINNCTRHLLDALNLGSDTEFGQELKQILEHVKHIHEEEDLLEDELEQQIEEIES